MSDNIDTLTPIAFDDIRKGDIIRAVTHAHGVTRTYEGEAHTYRDHRAAVYEAGEYWATKEGDFIATSNERAASTTFRTPRGLGLPTYYLVHRVSRPLPSMPGTVIKVTAAAAASCVGAALTLDNEGDLIGVLGNGTWVTLSARGEAALIDDYEVLYSPEAADD